VATDIDGDPRPFGGGYDLGADEFVHHVIHLPVVVYPCFHCCDGPVLLSPPNGGNLDTLAPLFRWDNGANPTGETVRGEVARDPGFAPGDMAAGMSFPVTPGEQEFRCRTNFDPDTVLYWRFFFVCSGGAQGPYSEVWSFTTGSGGTYPQAPELTAPEDGSTVSSDPVILQWVEVDGSLEYLVHWRKAGQMGFFSTFTEVPQAELGGLDPGTTYEWWVRARNGYAYGYDSEMWQFTIPAEAASR
jgi:hypothetical protein